MKLFIEFENGSVTTWFEKDVKEFENFNPDDSQVLTIDLEMKEHDAEMVDLLLRVQKISDESQVAIQSLLSELVSKSGEIALWLAQKAAESKSS